jgi:hypothetical protein
MFQHVILSGSDNAETRLSGGTVDISPSEQDAVRITDTFSGRDEVEAFWIHDSENWYVYYVCPSRKGNLRC